jgi:AcrR family transcriptional regulator
VPSARQSKASGVSVLSRRARRLLDGPGARGDDREAQLLAIGERLLEEGKFNKTSISSIAGEAGVSRSAFYFYFSCKEELLAELVARTLHESLEQWAMRADDPSEDPEELVRYIIGRSATMWVDHAQVMCAAVELFSRVPEIQAQWLGAVSETREPLARLIVNHTLVPELRDIDRALRLAESLIWLFERNFYIVTFKGGDPDEHQAAIETVAEAWIGAIGLRSI